MPGLADPELGGRAVGRAGVVLGDVEQGFAHIGAGAAVAAADQLLAVGTGATGTSPGSSYSSPLPWGWEGSTVYYQVVHVHLDSAACSPSPHVARRDRFRARAAGRTPEDRWRQECLDTISAAGTGVLAVRSVPEWYRSSAGTEVLAVVPECRECLDTIAATRSGVLAVRSVLVERY